MLVARRGHSRRTNQGDGQIFGLEGPSGRSTKKKGLGYRKSRVCLCVFSSLYWFPTKKPFEEETHTHTHTHMPTKEYGCKLDPKCRNGGGYSK